MTIMTYAAVLIVSSLLLFVVSCKLGEKLRRRHEHSRWVRGK